MRAGSERICHVRGVSGRPRCRLREQARLQQDRVWLGMHNPLARPAREANDAECQADRGVGFASKLGSNRTAYGSGCTTCWRGLPAKLMTRSVRQIEVSASRASSAPTGPRMAQDARLVGGLPAKLTTRSVRQTEVSASRASSAPTGPRMAWGARLVGARPAREANDAECQVDRGVGFASKLDSNKTAYGSGCTTLWPAKLTTRSVRQTEVPASRASSAPTGPRMAPARLVGARLAREANDAQCQADRGAGFASKLGSNKTAYGLGRTTCWSEARPRS